jgi:hypothetical protein
VNFVSGDSPISLAAPRKVVPTIWCRPIGRGDTRFLPEFGKPTLDPLAVLRRMGLANSAELGQRHIADPDPIEPPAALAVPKQGVVVSATLGLVDQREQATVAADLALPRRAIAPATTCRHRAHRPIAGLLGHALHRVDIAIHPGGIFIPAFQILFALDSGPKALRKCPKRADTHAAFLATPMPPMACSIRPTFCANSLTAPMVTPIMSCAGMDLPSPLPVAALKSSA